MPKEIELSGVYAVMTNPDGNKIAFVPLQPEDMANGGKAEKIRSADAYVRLEGDMYGTVSGAVEAGELPDDAIRREIQEELQIDPSSVLLTNGLAELSVQQLRKGVEVKFNTQGYHVGLSSSVVQRVQEHQPVTEVSLGAIDTFLKRELIRPSTKQAVLLFLARLQP
ncbi:MAG: NUDIX domain-containing protein [Patescibacteria group bacterium]